MAETARLYTQPSCGGCIGAKNVLKKLGIPFVEVNVREGEQAAREVAEFCAAEGVQASTPVVVFGDEVVVGFRLDELKALKKD